MQKTVLITGASRGIGAETARRFSAGGCAVALPYPRRRGRAPAPAGGLCRGLLTAVTAEAPAASAAGHAAGTRSRTK